jgi:hypothetical protein
VETGICGDSLINTRPGTKAGVLMYLPNMNPESNTRDGDHTPHETSLTLSFSALLIAYIETVSIVRKAVYHTPRHPNGGQLYQCIEWDFGHPPFDKQWTVFATPKYRKRRVRLDTFAKERAAVWLQAERAAAPESWKDVVSPPIGLARGARVSLRLQTTGVVNWVDAVVVTSQPLKFNVTVLPHTLCRTDTSMFFVS